MEEVDEINKRLSKALKDRTEYLRGERVKRFYKKFGNAFLPLFLFRYFETFLFKGV